LVQPVAVIVTVSEYVVAVVGETVGFADADVKPEGFELHEYVRPATAAAPSNFDPPRHIALLVPAFSVGNGLTVTTTVLVFEQPVAVMVCVRE
jgi:hypothetical protein